MAVGFDSEGLGSASQTLGDALCTRLFSDVSSAPTLTVQERGCVDVRHRRHVRRTDLGLASGQGRSERRSALQQPVRVRCSRDDGLGETDGRISDDRARSIVHRILLW